MAILNIEINPSLIDINVHPTKLEVKFSDEKAVYKCGVLRCEKTHFTKYRMYRKSSVLQKNLNVIHQRDS